MTVLVWTFGLVLALALAGVGWEIYATSRDRRRYPPPGRLVDAGASRLHMVEGGRSDKPLTVILECGSSMPSPHLEWVRSRIGDFARVVAYDRPGLGWSDPLPGGETHDARTIAGELYAALGSAGIPGPYVVVALGQGALHTIVFADRYPDEVAGVVLVEPQHPDAYFRLRNGARLQRRQRFIAGVTPTLARLGAMHLFRRTLIKEAEGLPPRASAELEAFMAQVTHVRSSSREVEALLQFTFPQVRRSRDFFDRPLIVLSASQDSIGGDRIHEEMAMLSSNSRHIVVDGASHGTIVTDAKHARVVADATRLVLNAAAHGRSVEASGASA
jgi:pimeloyl-ACP methyl ester carboxylesterase